jgi:hypothetical protein
MRRIIRVMPDYGCSPLWNKSWDATREEYSIELDSLEVSTTERLIVSDTLKEALRTWAHRFDATLNHEYPPDGGFSTVEEEQQFIMDGRHLALQLASELGGQYCVSYYYDLPRVDGVRTEDERHCMPHHS